MKKIARGHFSENYKGTELTYRFRAEVKMWEVTLDGVPFVEIFKRLGMPANQPGRL